MDWLAGMDWLMEGLSAVAGLVVKLVDGDLSGEPHNHAYLILGMFAAATAVWHLVLWPFMRRGRRFWRSIDYVWYAGAFLSLVLGTFQTEADAKASGVLSQASTIQLELERRELVVTALVIECERVLALDAGAARVAAGVFDLRLCEAARPILDDARKYAFEHISGADTLYFLQAKTTRMDALCETVSARSAKASTAAESDERVPERELFHMLYCDDAARIRREVADYGARTQSIAASKQGQLGSLAHMWPLLLSLVVGLRITKTTAELRQARRT